MKKNLGILFLAVLLIFSAGCISTDSIEDAVNSDDSAFQDAESLSALTSLFSQSGGEGMGDFMNFGGDESLDAESLAALSTLLSQSGDPSAMLEILTYDDASMTSDDLYCAGYPSEEELQQILQMYQMSGYQT